MSVRNANAGARAEAGSARRRGCGCRWTRAGRRCSLAATLEVGSGGVDPRSLGGSRGASRARSLQR
eukprot:7379826-Prymnesium_polylepis.1